MNKKTVLYFGDNTSKKDHVVHVLEEMRIPYTILEDKDLSQYVGYHMQVDGIPYCEHENKQHVSQDLMILNNIEDDEISEMNTRMDALHVSMKRKAMLTKHNQHWSVYDLLMEINKEHEYFQYVEMIRSILTQSSELCIDAYTKDSWFLYEKAFMAAYECITKESSLEDVKHHYEALTTAKENLKKIRL